jgi:L-alanine-DL-glutamate epimerase-like enolase superfamily enzyme
MRITAIREVSVRLEGQVANAVVSFAEHDVSLVAVLTDIVRGGRPVVGLAFNSIGRFAQGGILRDRMIPRVLAAAPGSLLDADGTRFDPARVLAAAMRNEKPGGHGDRAGAAAAIELAIWDLNAKLADEPAHATIARAHGRPTEVRDVDVYAAGGYYYEAGRGRTLADELRVYRDSGFVAFKMKIGGAALEVDLQRIEEALAIAGDGCRLAVDANGRLELGTALAYARALAPYGLRWFEEIGDPLDFALNARVIEAYGGAVATGENLFSLADTRNLLRYGGMRPGRDVFQMDAGLAYGLTEYVRILEALEAEGFDRRFAYPHGGHLINLHIAVGLGLGGCEAYPGVFQPFGGYSPQCVVGAGRVRPSAAPGFGLEEKPELARAIAELAG